jgi:hypothetical protein
MSENFEEANQDSPEARESRQDHHRRTMEEIRAAVTRGTAGLEASYFFDQDTLSLAREAH